jgi:hypothetical protein
LTLWRLLEGKIHVGPRRIGQRGATNIPNDTDDLGIAVLTSNLLPNRVFTRKETLTHRFADDHHRVSFRSIPGVEQPARPQRDPECPEIAPARRLPSDVGRPLASGHRAVRAIERSAPVVAGQRHDDGSPGRFDALQPLKRIEGASVERRPRRLFAIAIRRQRDIQREDPLDLESWIDREQPREASQHEPRTGEQQDGQRGFDHHQCGRCAPG